MADRTQRVKSLISRNISDILTFEIKNPKIGMVSANEIVINNDNSLAKVYVSFFDKGNPEKKMEELNRTKGFVRSSLAKKMDTYKVPDIMFIYDDSFDREKRMNELLSKEEKDIENAKKGLK